MILLHVHSCFTTILSLFVLRTHTHTQELRAALQMFTDHVTVCDHHVRASLLAELAAVCGAGGHGGAGAVVGMSGEVRVSAARLAVYSEHLPQHILQQGTVQYSKLCNVLHYPLWFCGLLPFFSLVIKIFFYLSAHAQT